MEWIKVTPDTMPPDMEPVMLTVEDEEGKRYTMSECRYNPSFGWEWAYDAGADYWQTIREKVTHWMEYPYPAQD